MAEPSPGSAQDQSNGQDAARVSLAELQAMYITAQTYFSRPALAVLSDAQARYYVPSFRDCRFASALPDMYRVLTTRTTAPEYFDLLTQSLHMRRQADGNEASDAQMRKAQEEVTAQMLVAIHEAEQKRLQHLRQIAEARRARARKQARNKGKGKGKGQSKAHGAGKSAGKDAGTKGAGGAGNP